MGGRNYKRFTQSLQPLLNTIGPDHLQPLLRETGISIRDLHSGDKLISRTQELALYSNLVRHPEYRGRAIGIDIGMSAQGLGPVGYAQMACRTAREAIELSKRYRCLTMPYLRWDVLVIGDEVVHRLTDTDGLGELRPFLMEMLLAILNRQTMELMGPECRATGLSLCYENPGSAQDYLNYFGVKPSFAQRNTEIRFPVAFLDCERQGYDPIMKASLEQLCQRMASQVMCEPDVADEVINILRASGDVLPGMEHIAQHFGLSSRALRSRLQRLGRSYRTLVDQVRRERAFEYLRDTTLTLPSVAQRCGFNELHSFYNAFKRWTGSSPAHYRSILVAGCL